MGVTIVGIMGLLFLFALVIAVLAPIVLGASDGRGMPMVLAVILTISAIVIYLAGKTVADTILAVGVWIGAMLAGIAAYLEGAMTRIARHHAFRIINNHTAGLRQPKDQE